MGDGSRHRTRLAPEVRKEQIIEAAIAVLAERDPAEVTFEEIADAAGVSRALVYNYFGDRGGLLGAVCVRSFDQLDAALAPAFDPALSPREQANEFVRRYLDFAVTHPGPWHLIGAAATSPHDAVHDVRRQRFDAIADRWGGTREARLIASAVTGMLDSVVLDRRDRGDDGLSAARVSELVSVLLWSGLKALAPEGAATRTPATAAPTAAG